MSAPNGGLSQSQPYPHHPQPNRSSSPVVALKVWQFVLIIVASVVAGALIASLAFTVFFATASTKQESSQPSAQTTKPSLTSTYESCRPLAASKESVEVNDDGSLLKGDFVTGGTSELLDCVAKKTGMPDSITGRISGANITHDGSGEKDWGEFHAEWAANYSKWAEADAKTVYLEIEIEE